ncbi:uncharacterized protein LOC111795770 [Cucurbita pepo subsp. pepo]|uniref:uncharacterized protein LOC111795770 n=1 Tax=Cucurbita pepo subsp. pepo TaxID=3664 RepID=UPI000C9D7429|nr:uncharacterized protein LOC111795770 [Cucurbita pepo subsp. pepo]
MDCLVLLPCYVMKRRRRRTAPRLPYRRLNKSESLVRVVVGKERTEFLVDPFVLEENPFRVLMEKGRFEEKQGKTREEHILFVDVDAILFDHLLWLIYNDSSSLLTLNLDEILHFYSQDF